MMNCPKIQLVQILHKLRIPVKPNNIIFTPYLPLSQLATVSTLTGQHSSGSGQLRCWTHLPSRDVLDKSRLINGQIFGEDYFEHLISEIQEIRASERRFYQKITDIYATAVDYSLGSQITKNFFAMVQNKMHYAVHGNLGDKIYCHFPHSPISCIIKAVIKSYQNQRRFS